MTREQFGRTLRDHRQRIGITRTELAARCGTSESAIRRIEGGSAPSVELADRLLRGLGLRLVLGDESSRQRMRIE